MVTGRSKRLCIRLGLLLLAMFVPGVARAADPAWVNGRIENVETKKESRVTSWVANTPISEEEITYQVLVHVKDRILVGEYKGGENQLPPPEEWVKSYPVRVSLDGNTMFLAPLAGDTLKLRIVRKKAAPPAEPLNASELAILNRVANGAGAESPVGFIKPEAEAKTAGAAAGAGTGAAAAESQAEESGTVSVSSTPYLSEIFVDGASMGYTPAKLKLAPGKHTFRVEKPGYKAWSKEIVVTAGSELRVDATLSK